MIIFYIVYIKRDLSTPKEQNLEELSLAVIKVLLLQASRIISDQILWVFHNYVVFKYAYFILNPAVKKWYEICAHGTQNPEEK